MPDVEPPAPNAPPTTDVAGYTTPLGILAFGGGVALVWSAVTGDSPLAELRKALSTGRVDGGEPTPIEPADSGYVATGPNATASDPMAPAGPGGSATARHGGGAANTERVSIGQGGHKLNPDAAAAFRRAEAAYGRTIVVTDSSRDYATQAANRQRDPSRFGPPDGNAHVEGRAVDVNLPALGLNPMGEPSDWAKDPGYAKLLRAMTSAGFCNYQVRNGTANGRTREPWHFAYGRCN